MRRKLVFSVVAISALAIGGWALHKDRSETSSRSGVSVARQSGPGVPPYYTDLHGVKVPATLPPQEFSNPAARKGYEIAAKIPKVLMQMPCYCHCDVMGHKSLLDCFTGKHAGSCDICLDSATFVYARWKAGVQIPTIRQQLIERNKAND